MTCAGQYCVAQTDGGNDSASSGGTSSGGVDAGGSSSGAVDAGGSSGTTSSSGGTSSSSGGVDAGSSSGSQDTGGGSSGGVLKVATLQQSTDSTTCAKKDGQNKVIEAAAIEDVIATQAPFKAGSSWIFHGRPASAPQVDGKWQGIKLFVHSGEPKVAAGDVVSITGDVVEYFCETEITAASKNVTVKSSGTAPTPYAVKTADITFNGDSEAYEGVFVTIQNVKVHEANYKGSDGKTHGGFAVVSQTDGSAVVHVDLASSSQFTTQDASKQLVTTFVQGQVISSITGHLNYSFGEFVLIPRGDADLVSQ